MNVKELHQFLKPSLEGLTEKEKEELCGLILGKPEPKPRKKKDSIMSKAKMKMLLMKTHFKSRA